MSGRERLRRGWLRFGKVGRKPNKDGKNRLCLEKNRCREEEEFPVVKGISKRVIVVKSPDPKIFEQAIFIIREDFAGQSGVSEKDVLRAPRRTAISAAENERPASSLPGCVRRSMPRRAPSPGSSRGLPCIWRISEKSEPVAFDRLRFFRLRDARRDDKINA